MTLTQVFMLLPLLEKSSIFPVMSFLMTLLKGRVWNHSSNAKPDCVYLEIDSYPTKLFENEDLFLQIYPFSVKEDQIEYGSSLAINTIKKIEEDDDTLITSQILDAHIVKTELALDPNHFFSDHLLEICGVGTDWEGIQFVIYERRIKQDSAPIRITKFLIPPFLAHPEHFKHEKGVELAALHPFLELIPEYKSQSQSYYDLAEDICL